MHLYQEANDICFTAFTTEHNYFNWCKEHKTWSENQWSHVLFTDEGRFILTSASKRVYIWKESGTRNLPQNIMARDCISSEDVIVQEGVMIDGCTPLHVFNSESMIGRDIGMRFYNLMKDFFRDVICI